MDLTRHWQEPEERQQPEHDGNHDDDVDDLQDLRVDELSAVRVHQPQKHADDDQQDDELDEIRKAPPFLNRVSIRA